jgi:hypothetical protein
MSRPTRAWPHLDDAEYDRRANLIRAGVDENDFPAIITQLYLSKFLNDKKVHPETLLSPAITDPSPAHTPELDPNASVETLKKLIMTGKAIVCARVAENPSTPLEVLEQLAADKRALVRETLAGSPYAPPIVLETLSRDRAARAIVARNSAVPIELLETLANHKNPWILRCVAENHAASISVLKRLAIHPNKDVRQGVALNRISPIALLELLAKDEEWDVRRGVATNPSTSLELLQNLAADDDVGVRVAVVHHSNISSALIEQLHDSYDPFIHQVIAESLRTPVDLLAKLALEGSSSVRSAIYRNPNATDEIRAQVALLGINEDDENDDENE